MTALRGLLVMAVGAFTGLLGGLFGKGGSAIATPLLHLAGVSPFAAVASPLPATIPSTLIAAWAYHRVGAVDRTVLRTTLRAGIPATIVGALATRWIGGPALIVVTDVIVAALGARILWQWRSGQDETTVLLPSEAAKVAVGAGGGESERPEVADGPSPLRPFSKGRSGEGPTAAATATVAIIVGLASGLLGNSGGFLLAPLFITVLHLPVKRALGTSLAAAAGLAVPGTLVHAAMGHIDWSVSLVFGLASIPLSAAGAGIALRTAAGRLEVLYGTALVLMGGGLLLLR